MTPHPLNYVTIHYIIAFPAQRAHGVPTMRRLQDMVEGMAVGAALICLVHCIALPVVIALLPALATVAPIPETFHIVALSFAVPATGGALFIGYRHHRLVAPMLIGGIGLALLALGVLRWGETPLEIPVTIFGSLLIAAAHIANWRLRHAGHAHLA